MSVAVKVADEVSLPNTKTNNFDKPSEFSLHYQSLSKSRSPQITQNKHFLQTSIFDFPKEKMIGQSINIIIYLDKHIISIVNIIIITILLFLIKITSLPYY